LQRIDKKEIWMKPKVVISDGRVYIDSIVAKRKRLPFWSHNRIIFLSDEFVVKYAPQDDENCAHEQNLKEREIWNKIEDCDLVYFAPLVYHSRKYGYVVQKRIRMKSRKRRASDYKIINHLSAKYHLDDLDGRDDNWCINQETDLPCIFDYGV
jgi:hypothetical protein